VEVEVDPFMPEPKVASQLWATIADRGRAAGTARTFPLILSGSCYATIGAVAGLGSVG